MALTDLLARPLAAGIFIVGGFDSLRHPDKKVPTAQTVTAPITQATGLDTEALVRVNGAVQVGAGLALATGRLPRLAALLLIGSLVPTTVAGHRFWEIDDAAGKRLQRLQFLKNLSMLGGLLSIATSTGGRPSLPWRARRALGTAVDTSVDTVQRLIPATG